MVCCLIFGEIMERKSKIEIKDIYTDWPILFWRECKECKKEFRREKVYRKLCGPFHGGHGTWRYVCGNCAKDKKKANELFEKLPPRPPMPKPRIK